MLYLIATPIGNLTDITLRALDVLKQCDYILCEDTRHSQILLKTYDIKKPLKSYHQFSEAEREQSILQDLQNGLNIALITDAGTPGISDPGERLVKACIQNQLPITSLPGPCALITALIASGLTTERFQFIGFLPKKASEIRAILQETLEYPGTTICYESPHRIHNAIAVIQELGVPCELVIARELTKKFEEFLRGSPSEILNQIQERDLKGEICLLIQGHPQKNQETLTIQEHVEHLQENLGIEKNEAIKLAAQERGVSKRIIYNALLKKSPDPYNEGQ